MRKIPTDRLGRPLELVRLQQEAKLRKYYRAQIPKWRHPIIGYLLSIPLVGLALLGGVLEKNLLPHFYFAGALLFISTILVALFWGVGPALFSVLLSAGALYYLIHAPVQELSPNGWMEVVQLLPFVFALMIIAIITGQRETARRRALFAEEEAKERVHELEAIFEAIADGIVVFDDKGQPVYSNAADRELLAPDNSHRSFLRSKSEPLSLSGIRDERGKLLPEESQPTTRILQGEVLKGANTPDISARTRDGSEVQISISGAPVRDSSGHVIGGVALLHDVTGRRQMEHHLQDYAQQVSTQSNQLEATFEAMTDGVVIYDGEGRILHMNAAYRSLIALDNSSHHAALSHQERGDMLALRDESGSPLPKEQRPVQRMLNGEVLTGANTMDILVRALDGHDVQLNVSGTPMRDQQGRIVGGVMIFRDVTERRQLERRTQQSLEALLEMAEALVQIPENTLSIEERTTTASPTISEVALRMAELISNILGCKRVGIVTVEPETEILQPVVVIGLSPEQERQWRNNLSGATIINELVDPALASRFRSGEVIMLDTAQTATSGLHGLQDFYKVRSFLAAPMHIGGRLVGALSLDYGDVEHEYSPEEITLAKTVARLAGLVIERERLLQERAQEHANALVLLEANRRMDEFLGIASHELKTPLTTMKGNVQLAARRLKSNLLFESATEEERKRALEGAQELIERVNSQINRMTRLVNDLLDVSRIHENKLEISLERHDLAAIVRDVVQEQRQVSSTRILPIEIPEEAVPVMADADRIGQVVINYLTNALKYSPPDCPVEVSLKVEGQMARVLVRDEGQGLPLEEQQRIWERFYRVKGIEVEAGSGLGLGLGLHICRSIIERHHGQVGVESVPGKGSTFWFTLPLAE